MGMRLQMQINATPKSNVTGMCKSTKMEGEMSTEIIGETTYRKRKLFTGNSRKYEVRDFTDFSLCQVSLYST